MAPLHIFNFKNGRAAFCKVFTKLHDLSINKVDKYLTQIVLFEFYLIFLMVVMDSRIDSCSSCGEDVEVLNTCMVCEKPTKFQCSNCFHYVDDPIHTECVIFDDSVI